MCVRSSERVLVIEGKELILDGTVSALLLGLRDREMTPIDADYLACHKVIAH